MLDAPVRRVLAAPLDAVAARIDRPGVSPDRLTVAGLGFGLLSAGLAASTLWWPALAAWLLSRVLDGLDGALARRRGSTEAGGFLDITCDFVSYAAGVVGVAAGVQAAGGAGLGDLWPFVAVLVAYYLNGASFLAFSSVAERTGHTLDDGRSFSFLGGLAEGTETVLVHSLWLALPAYAPQVAWVWALVVGVSAAQRVVGGYRTLSGPVTPGREPDGPRPGPAPGTTADGRG